MPIKQETETLDRHTKFRVDFLTSYDVDRKLLSLSQKLHKSKLLLAFQVFEAGINELYEQHFPDEL